MDAVSACSGLLCTCSSLKAWILDEQDGEVPPPASTGHTTKNLLAHLAQIRVELRQIHANTPGAGPPLDPQPWRGQFGG